MEILFELVMFLVFSMVDYVSSEKKEDGGQENLPAPPPGYYFVPSASQLIQNYLVNKILGLRLATDMVKAKKDVELLDPSKLDFEEFKYCREKEAYYISNKAERKTDGTATILKTTSGYWRETKEECTIYNGDQIIGYRKRFTFYEGEEEDGVKTFWRMKEFRLNPEIISAHANEMEVNVACKIRYKEPEFFGELINEEENEEDDEEEE